MNSKLYQRVVPIKLGPRLRSDLDQFRLLLKVLEKSARANARRSDEGPYGPNWIGDKIFAPQRSPVEFVRDDARFDDASVAFVLMNVDGEPVSHLFITFDDRGRVEQHQKALTLRFGSQTVPLCCGRPQILPPYSEFDVNPREVIVPLQDAAQRYLEQLRDSTGCSLVRVVIDSLEVLQREFVSDGFELFEEDDLIDVRPEPHIEEVCVSTMIGVDEQIAVKRL